MAGIRISALPTTGTAAPTDEVPTNTLGGTPTVKRTLAQLLIGAALTTSPVAFGGALSTAGTFELVGTAANIKLNTNFISYGGTDAGFSLDASNNATLSGTLTVSGAGPHAIGGATVSYAQLYLRGTFAGTGGGVNEALRVESTLTVAVNDVASGIRIFPTINKAGSGVHNQFASLHVDPPTIGAGAAALTNAAAIYVVGAPTGATNNYALWVDAGTVRIDGTDGAGAGVGTLTNAPTAGNPAFWLPINSNGTTYYLPCWT